jgi:GT2 family glycosyltransferase
MELSIIIATYNRAIDLKETFVSIISQTILPKEVIVIDDSNNNETEKLIKDIKDIFENKVILKYLHNSSEKSLTIARNMGVKYSSGDIILFLDDDVLLDENYIEELLKVYDLDCNANGVQGYIYLQYCKPIIDKHKLFFLNFFEYNRCRLLPSTQNTYPFILTKMITCQWLSGSNQSYRSKILHEFNFDENLKRYASKEDMDFSYRVHKKYPDTLYITPKARLIHKTSNKARLPERRVITMKEVYSFYFFYKNIDQTLKNKLIFLWSRMGPIIIDIFRLFHKPSKSQLIEIKYLLDIYLYCLRHRLELENGDIGFFNKTL